MKRLLCLLVLVPTLSFAQAPEPQYNLVTLNAQADREVPNDLMTAVLAAQFDGPESAPLAERTNRAMSQALDAARAYKSVQARSGSYQTTPQYNRDGQITGWQVRQELRLESLDFAAAAELVGKLQASLVVTSMSFTVSPEMRRRTENSLITEALAAFDERAEIIRSARKEKGYRVRSLQISNNPVYPVPYSGVPKPAARSESVPAPTIAAGTSRILITVSGTIQLQ